MEGRGSIANGLRVIGRCYMPEETYRTALLPQERCADAEVIGTMVALRGGYIRLRSCRQERVTVPCLVYHCSCTNTA